MLILNKKVVGGAGRMLTERGSGVKILKGRERYSPSMPVMREKEQRQKERGGKIKNKIIIFKK